MRGPTCASTRTFPSGMAVHQCQLANIKECGCTEPVSSERVTRSGAEGGCGVDIDGTSHPLLLFIVESFRTAAVREQ